MHKKVQLQAIERVITDNNWITLVIIFAIVLLATLKLLKPNRLLGYLIAFLTPGFFKKKVEDNTSFYEPFNLLLFLFSSIIISLFLFLVVNFTPYEYHFINYLIVFSAVILYLSIKHFIKVTIANTLGLSTILKYFLVVKSGYLKSLSLWLFPAIIIHQYTFNSNTFLLTIFGILFVFRAFLILKNNKRIVMRKFFYFILYFCTLEIAPLLIAYKITMTT
ncbi:DUF4271 domain-containing protein [Tenacibaculum retecalamus]|uniref:DUF4271 domain-containing protein n=1 Tax=Tenacibaculum retecalamus TaxID=3018315 RepID=UPI0023D94A9B|nr:DUF4271 domain-containing protein [Tenacibaculum retecalamus]WBX71009.1 DUF4271 domain-containing protein [Tenacibaculum retecalamus]